MKTYKLLYIPTACYICWRLGSFFLSKYDWYYKDNNLFHLNYTETGTKEQLEDFLLSKYDWYYKDNNLFHLNYTETGTKEQLEDLLNCMLLYYKEDYPELNISSEHFEVVEVDT